MKKIMMAAACAALFAGCVSVNKNDGGNACLQPRIIKDAVYEKFTVGDKPVTATEKCIGICGFIVIGSTASHISDHAPDKVLLPNAVLKAKNGAYAKACEAAGCDSIVGARYKVKNTDYFVYNIAEVEVTGYPAKMTGVELAPCCPKACPKVCPKACSKK